MYSWGDDTSDWAKPGTYAYSESTKAVRETSRVMPAGAEQEGQSCTSGAPTGWILSSLSPQLAQAYS